MDLRQIIAQLRSELKSIDQAIEALSQLVPGPLKDNVDSSKGRRRTSSHRPGGTPQASQGRREPAALILTSYTNNATRS